MSLTLIHARLAIAMLMFLTVAGIWGLVAYFRQQQVSGTYWGILAVGEILILAQVIIGSILLIQGARPDRGVHLLYGSVAIVALPGYYAYTRGEDDRRAYLTYGLICLFLVGISIRAMTTALPQP